MRTHFLSGLTLAALLSLAVAGAALAQDADDHGPSRPMMREMLAKFDTNKDGKLDADERTAVRAEHFKRLDGNGDGKVTKAEFPAAVQAAQEKERADRLAARFDAMDTNKDGTVTSAEFLAYKPEHGRKHHDKGDKR